MPPRIWSRYEFCIGVTDQADKKLLSSRKPYRYQSFSDNEAWTVRTGDTLFSIAGAVYKGFTDRPSGFWWIIADFQLHPILDPTLSLEEGRIIICPSKRTIREEIFNPAKRQL